MALTDWVFPEIDGIVDLLLETVLCRQECIMICPSWHGANNGYLCRHDRRKGVEYEDQQEYNRENYDYVGGQDPCDGCFASM